MKGLPPKKFAKGECGLKRFIAAPDELTQRWGLLKRPVALSAFWNGLYPAEQHLLKSIVVHVAGLQDTVLSSKAIIPHLEQQYGDRLTRHGIVVSTNRVLTGMGFTKWDEFIEPFCGITPPRFAPKNYWPKLTAYEKTVALKIAAMGENPSCWGTRAPSEVITLLAEELKSDTNPDLDRARRQVITTVSILRKKLGIPAQS